VAADSIVGAQRLADRDRVAVWIDDPRPSHDAGKRVDCSELSLALRFLQIVDDQRDQRAAGPVGVRH
jgi:hypothetical protein